MRAISVRDQRFVLRHRPGDAESGVAPHEAAIVLMRVIGTYFVNDFGIRLQRAITMGEPFGNEDLAPPDSAQHSCEMATKLGEPQRMSTATSKIEPAVTRNSFA